MLLACVVLIYKYKPRSQGEMKNCVFFPQEGGGAFV